MKIAYSYKIDVLENEMLSFNNMQLKFDIRTLYELLEKAEHTDDSYSEYSGSWQSCELADLIIKSINALGRIEKFINKCEINDK